MCQRDFLFLKRFCWALRCQIVALKWRSRYSEMVLSRKESSGYRLIEFDGCDAAQAVGEQVVAQFCRCTELSFVHLSSLRVCST